MPKQNLIIFWRQLKIGKLVNVEPDYQTIKELLTSIKRIRGQSMDMELEIIESLEQFRVLRMYEHPIEPEDDEKINKLE